MSYEKYSNPQNGYNSFANPTNSEKTAGSNNPNKTSIPRKTKPPYGTNGKFTELLAQNGVGNYHINHFIGYFREKPFNTTDLKIANDKFFKSFHIIFPFTNIAGASVSKYKFNNNATIEFKLGGNVGNWINKKGGEFHSDWVSLQKEEHLEGFYASTLKREWYEEKEFKAMQSLVPYLLVLGDKKDAVDYAIHLLNVNQHHFLAGRRYFSIGFDGVKKLFFIETATFERNSICEYNVLDNTGILRKDIIALWTNLIRNFETLAEVKLIDFLSRPTTYLEPFQLNPDSIYFPEGYMLENKVAYNLREDKSSTNILKTDWFVPLLTKHQALVKDFK